MGLFSKEKPVDQKLVILGKEIDCPICGGNHFKHRRILMNSSGMTILGLEWLNKEASTYTCTNCYHMLYFNFNS